MQSEAPAEHNINQLETHAVARRRLRDQTVRIASIYNSVVASACNT